MSIQRDTLRAFTPFDTLSDEYLDKVLEKAQLDPVTRGTLIFKRGKTLETQYYLVSGQVDLIDAQFERQSLEAGSDLSRYPLADHSPTQVSAVAKSDVELLSLESDFLDLVMAWSQSGDHPEGRKGNEEDDSGHDWMSSLLESPLFTRVPPSHIQKLFVRFEEIDFDRDDWVLREGEPGDYFYVLESGQAQVSDKMGRPLAQLGAGDYFGEEALVGDTTRNANVQMLAPGRLMRLGKDDFIALLQAPALQLIPADQWPDRQAQLGEYQLLDVRLPVEQRFGRVEGSRNLPLGQLRQNLPELAREATYVVADDAGRRSYVAAQLLIQVGLDVFILEEASQLHGQKAG